MGMRKKTLGLGLIAFGVLALALTPGWAGISNQPTLTFSLQTQAAGQSVFVAGDFSGWDGERLPMRETRPGHYTLTVPRPWGTEISYKFVVDEQWIADPANNHAVADGWGGYNSVIEFPEFREDRALEQGSEFVEWKRTVLKFTDPTDFDERQVVVLSPPQARLGPSGRERVFVYFQDGEDYLNAAQAATILSNLSRERSMPEFVGVFIPPRERMEEYALSSRSEKYIELLAETIVPAVEAKFAAYGSPPAKKGTRRLLVGPSLGGLVSAFASIRYPALFPNMASQSGAFWYREAKITAELDRLESGKQLNWSLDAGFFEAENLRQANFRF
ncbi:MAG: alpha/beta hydrolase-fold protein, partial [Bdellovibrionota bacterium]